MNQERQRLFRQIQFDFMLCESSIVPQSSKSVTFFLLTEVPTAPACFWRDGTLYHAHEWIQTERRVV